MLLEKRTRMIEKKGPHHAALLRPATIRATVIYFILSLVPTLPTSSTAGVFEFSVGMNFNKSTYSSNSFSWTRRWGSSIGYHFTERSGFEFSFQDVVDRTLLTGSEDTTFHDQVFAVNWIQDLLGKTSFFQPYFKLGIGQLNRRASGVYSSGINPVLILDSVTGVMGVGTRWFFSKSVGVRVEGTSYLSGGSIRTWNDNFAILMGLSVYF